MSDEFLTYEATKARQSTQSQPDKIHWDRTWAFRESPYRHLHHQRGVIGVFRIRLLEAADLQRSYWSALALGPVRHLGLSKAHGAVSSYCSLSLAFADTHHEEKISTTSKDLDKKPAAKKRTGVDQVLGKSQVVPQDNNPTFDSQFEVTLRKGAMPRDGMRVVLHVRVDEDATAIESMVPIIPSGGDTRLLGVGKLDLTDLCLGETEAGKTVPSVLDAWIPISLKGQELPGIEDETYYDKDDPLSPPRKRVMEQPPPVTGMVRILASYQPHGLDPQVKDVIALEAFARRNPATSSCRPVLPPLMPLTVLERRGNFVLAAYSANDNRKACVRLHRNAVFVIERQNLVDAAHNLAMLPADVWMSTPVGRAVGEVSAPVVAASKEVLMPALLSVKLVWMAFRTTTLAGMSGVQALGSTFWNEGANSLTANHREAHLYRRDSSASNDRKAATAQFVQL